MRPACQSAVLCFPWCCAHELSWHQHCLCSSVQLELRPKAAVADQDGPVPMEINGNMRLCCLQGWVRACWPLAAGRLAGHQARASTALLILLCYAFHCLSDKLLLGMHLGRLASALQVIRKAGTRHKRAQPDPFCCAVLSSFWRQASFGIILGRLASALQVGRLASTRHE